MLAVDQTVIVCELQDLLVLLTLDFAKGRDFRLKLNGGDRA